MQARTALIAVAFAVVAIAAIPVAGLAATDGPMIADQHENSTDANATDANASVAPGERLSGVVGVQQAELEGEVDGRAFGLQIASAATNESRAEVVGQQVENIQQRLDDLEQRREKLDEARANGSMSEGKYRAEVAELAARTETVKDLANRSENATEGLPADLLESKGVNVTAIQTLKDRAQNMTGPEVAEIARSIAGKASPVDRGPGDRPGGPPEDRPGQDGEDGATPEDRKGGDGAAGQDGPPEDRQGGDGNDGTDAATPTPDGDGTDSATSTPDGGDSAGDGGDGSDSAGDGGDGGDRGGDGGDGGY